MKAQLERLYKEIQKQRKQQQEEAQRAEMQRQEQRRLELIGMFADWFGEEPDRVNTVSDWAEKDGIKVRFFEKKYLDKYQEHEISKHIRLLHECPTCMELMQSSPCFDLNEVAVILHEWHPGDCQECYNGKMQEGPEDKPLTVGERLEALLREIIRDK